jgi:hypothetical protein
VSFCGREVDGRRERVDEYERPRGRRLACGLLEADDFMRDEYEYLHDYQIDKVDGAGVIEQVFILSIRHTRWLCTKSKPQRAK